MKDSKAVHELIAEGDRILGEGQNALGEAWEQDVVERLEYERDQAQSWYVNCMKLPYSRKIWRGIKFGGLAGLYYNCQAKISYSHIYVW